MAAVSLLLIEVLNKYGSGSCELPRRAQPGQIRRQWEQGPEGTELLAQEEKGPGMLLWTGGAAGQLCEWDSRTRDL